MTDSPFSVRASVLQVSVTGPSGAPVELLGAGGDVLRSGAIDDFGNRLALPDLGVTDTLTGQGGLVLRGLEPGPYTLVLGGRPGRGGADADADAGDRGGIGIERRTVTVLDPWVLPDDFDERVRGQRIDPGYGYIEVRDGATLSANVFLPDAAAWGDGPYPTLVQYSGYVDSRPGFVTGDPGLDCVLNTEANLALLLGYAVVGVSLRGCGGSEGSFLLFEPIQGTDGHDVIEAIAAQPWVATKRDGRPKVGMIGRSMPGYTQLLVASFQPPSLAAITPAAVGGRPYGAAGRPGGIVNADMALGIAGWQIDPIEPVDGVRQHQPARYEPGGWDDWIPELVASGDERCARNQLLRGQNLDAVPAWAYVEHEEGGILAHADGEAWARTITAPTLVLGAWQDQLSGPWFTELLDQFPGGTVARLAAYNGTHEETRFPQSLTRWLEFLGLFVREELPVWNDDAQRYLDTVAHPLFPEGLPVSFDRYRECTVDQALERFLGEPPIVVAFDNGAAPDHPEGYPYTAFSVGFDGWPPSDAHPQRWFLAPQHLLERDVPPPGRRPLGFHYEPAAMPPVAAAAADVNAACPSYDWRTPPGGRALQFATAPFDADTLLVGPASLDLWLRSSADDIDLEVVLSEVRPDGWETYVQAGWLRTSYRSLDTERSTELAPRLSYRAADVAPLPSDGFSLVRVPIPGMGHHLRAGSRVGITVGAAGGNQPQWRLAALHPDGRDENGRRVVVEVSVERSHPSSLVLPVVETWRPLEGAPDAALPPLDVLRRQPSRRWRPAGAALPAVGERPLARVVRDRLRTTPAGRAAARVKRRLWTVRAGRPRVPGRLAAGVGLAAVVGLLAAGVGLALVRLLRHKSYDRTG